MYILHFPASGGGDGGVCVTLWPGARTRLWDHSGEEGAAGGKAAERGVPTLHGAHEEPMGDDRLDGCLESGVRASCATCPTAEYIIHYVGALGIKLTFNSVSLFYILHFLVTFFGHLLPLLITFYNRFGMIFTSSLSHYTKEHLPFTLLNSENGQNGLIKVSRS